MGHKKTQLFTNNYTQFPNFLMEAVPHMSSAGVRVMLAVVRKTFGWHKLEDQISLSQLVELTGMSRKGVVAGVKECESPSIGILRKTRHSSGNTYKILLPTDEVVTLGNYQNDEVVTQGNQGVVTQGNTQKKGENKEEKESTAPAVADMGLREDDSDCHEVNNTSPLEESAAGSPNTPPVAPSPPPDPLFAYLARRERDSECLANWPDVKKSAIDECIEAASGGLKFTVPAAARRACSKIEGVIDTVAITCGWRSYHEREFLMKLVQLDRPPEVIAAILEEKCRAMLAKQTHKQCLSSRDAWMMIAGALREQHVPKPVYRPID